MDYIYTWFAIIYTVMNSFEIGQFDVEHVILKWGLLNVLSSDVFINYDMYMI